MVLPVLHITLEIVFKMFSVLVEHGVNTLYEINPQMMKVIKSGEKKVKNFWEGRLNLKGCVSSPSSKVRK